MVLSMFSYIFNLAITIDSYLVIYSMYGILISNRFSICIVLYMIIYISMYNVIIISLLLVIV